MEEYQRIDISNFETCEIDGKPLKEICLLFGGGNKYKLQAFRDYIKEKYNLSIQEYCEKYLNIIWKKSPKTKKYLGYKISGKGIRISNFARGEINQDNCEAFKESCQKSKITRLKEGNPMFGKKPWNRGLNASNNIIMAEKARKAKGKKLSKEHIKHLTEARRNSKYQARHTQKMSEENKRKTSLRNVQMYNKGIFRRKTSIYKKVESFLLEIFDQLIEKPLPEHPLEVYSLDFGFPNLKIDLEVNGKYFHVDKRFYPNGPINEMQRKNFQRDKAKKTYLKNKGWKLIEVWETEINNGEFKEELLCKFKELNLLKK
jgi:hypothetical protein